MDEILLYFPLHIREKMRNIDFTNLEEIRIRNNRPIFLKIGQSEQQVNYIINTNDVLEILQKICDNSIYTYQNQICNGYITIKGGHRIGITGNIVIKDGQVTNISHIYSLNFRIARQIIDCSNKILESVLDLKNNTVFNTIIISPPGRGKTTILRDLIRKISDGIPEISFNGINVGVVDERGEIAAMYKGIPQNDIGRRTDILDNIPKDIGMKMLIRSMNPKVIVADEIGSTKDIEAIKYAICSGVKGVFTAHGNGLKDIINNPILNELYITDGIERVLAIDENRNVHLEYEKSERRAV